MSLSLGYVVVPSFWWSSAPELLDAQIAGINLAVWRIHRRIGMSGGLFAGGLLRETGRPVEAAMVTQLQRAHSEAFQRRADGVRLLPGARELLQHLSSLKTPWAVATSGAMEASRPALDLLKVPPDAPVVTRDEVAHAKPDPDLFLAAAERLGVDITDAVVVGDSIWDLLAARRARALGVGLLAHLDEVGVRTPHLPAG